MSPTLYHERRARRARAWRSLAIAAIALGVATTGVLALGPAIGGHRIVVLSEAREPGKAVLMESR